ncbi:MAG: hypothetical protein JNM79_01210 [Burkholderiales bacterium]|nr:hypothetical protein [Burkholderiales bacterium]
MPESINPFAPPAANLEAVHQLGQVHVEGKLVCMERGGALPDRCVACDSAARGQRVSLTLYWVPGKVRIALLATASLLIILLALGEVFDPSGTGTAFFVLLVLAYGINVLARKKVVVEVGVCARHMRLRKTLRFIAIACTSTVLLALFFAIRGVDTPQAILFALPVVLIVLVIIAVIDASTGVRRLRVARMDERHLWRKGTRAAFRAGLPKSATETA